MQISNHEDFADVNEPGRLNREQFYHHRSQISDLNHLIVTLESTKCREETKIGDHSLKMTAPMNRLTVMHMVVQKR